MVTFNKVPIGAKEEVNAYFEIYLPLLRAKDFTKRNKTLAIKDTKIKTGFLNASL